MDGTGAVTGEGATATGSGLSQLDRNAAPAMTAGTSFKKENVGFIIWVNDFRPRRRARAIPTRQAEAALAFQ